MTRSPFLALALLAAACGNNDASMDPKRQALLQSPLCQATDAKASFGAAICVCNDLALTGAGFIAHSTAGQTADVGVNGVDRVVGSHKVSGSITAMQGFTGVGSLDVGQSLSTVADLTGVGSVVVGKDMMVGGAVEDVGSLQVGGTLGVAGAMQLTGAQQIGARGAYVAPSEPCGCAAPAVDVAQRITDARTTATALGTETDVGSTELKLATGSYFLESLSTVGSMHMKVDGAVALFVAGDFKQVGSETISLTPGSTLDLYVGGQYSTVGSSGLGDGADPGSVRLFLANEQSASFSVGSASFNASIYAPKAEISVVGSTQVHGAIFAKALTGVGSLDVDYAGPVAADPDKCAPPDTTTDGSGAPTMPGDPGSGGIN